jgi:hypothetical protein
MAMKTRKEVEKQTKMDDKFKKQCIVNLSKKKEGRK